MQPSTLFHPAPSKSDLARSRLLEAALRVFGEKGLAGATVRDIAQAAGQNVAAIAYYFGSKEKLYHAMLEGIVRLIRQNLADLLGQIEALRHQAEPSPAEARRLFIETLRAVYLRFLSRNEAIPVARLIVLEQTQPSAGFDILYQHGFRDVHEALCFLVGTALGRSPRDRETILRTHTLMGQVYFFAMSREAILRRMGWKSLEGKNAELVADILKENLEVLLTALATQSHPSTTVPPAS